MPDEKDDTPGGMPDMEEMTDAIRDALAELKESGEEVTPEKVKEVGAEIIERLEAERRGEAPPR